MLVHDGEFYFLSLTPKKVLISNYCTKGKKRSTGSRVFND